MPSSSSDQWHYAQGNTRHGPVSKRKLKKLADQGLLGPDDLVWCEGMKDWVTARKLKGLIPQELLAGGATKTSAPAAKKWGPPQDEAPAVSAAGAAQAPEEGDSPAAVSEALAEAEWYYAVDEEQKGPVSLDALRALLADETLTADDLVWCDQLDDWTAAEQVPALIVEGQAATRISPPAEPAPPPKAGSPRRAPPRAGAALEDFSETPPSLGRLSRDEWYYAEGEEQVGPVTRDELHEMAGSGELSPDTLIWRLGLEDWFEARELEGLFPESRASLQVFHADETGAEEAPAAKASPGFVAEEEYEEALPGELAVPRTPEDLAGEIMNADPGAQIKVTFYQDDELIERVLTVGKRDELADRVAALEKRLRKLEQDR